VEKVVGLLTMHVAVPVFLCASNGKRCNDWLTIMTPDMSKSLHPAAVVQEQPQVDAPPEVDEPPPDEPEEGDPNDALKPATLPAPPAGPQRNYVSSDELDRIIAACGGPFRGAALTTGGRSTGRQAGRGRTGRERRPIIDLETGVPA